MRNYLDKPILTITHAGRRRQMKVIGYDKALLFSSVGRWITLAETVDNT